MMLSSPVWELRDHANVQAGVCYTHAEQPQAAPIFPFIFLLPSFYIIWNHVYRALNHDIRALNHDIRGLNARNTWIQCPKNGD